MDPTRLRAHSLLLSAWFCTPTQAYSLPGIDAYCASLAVHPLETKLATAATLAVAGDAIAQWSASQHEDVIYDVKRAASFMIFDSAYRGGFQHAAFPLIISTFHGNTFLHSGLPLSGMLADPRILSAIECTAFNQFVLVPLIYYPLFFSVTGAVQGLTAEQAIARAQKTFVPLTLRNYGFWIPVQFCQFAFLPEDIQVPYTCVMGLIWNIILSSVAGAAKDTREASIAEKELAGELMDGVVVPAYASLSVDAGRIVSRNNELMPASKLPPSQSSSSD